MILSFRSVASIPAKFTGAVTRWSGGETEELMRSGVARLLWLEFHPQEPNNREAMLRPNGTTRAPNSGAIAYTFIRGRQISACALSYISLRFVRVVVQFEPHQLAVAVTVEPVSEAVPSSEDRNSIISCIFPTRGEESTAPWVFLDKFANQQNREFTARKQGSPYRLQGSGKLERRNSRLRILFSDVQAAASEVRFVPEAEIERNNPASKGNFF